MPQPVSKEDIKKQEDQILIYNKKIASLMLNRFSDEAEKLARNIAASIASLKELCLREKESAFSPRMNIIKNSLALLNKQMKNIFPSSQQITSNKQNLEEVIIPAWKKVSVSDEDMQVINENKKMSRDYFAEKELLEQKQEEPVQKKQQIVQPENKKIKIVQFNEEDRKKLEQMMNKPLAKEVQQPVQQQVNKQLDINSSIKEQNSKPSVIKQAIPELLVTEVKQSVQQQEQNVKSETKGDDLSNIILRQNNRFLTIANNIKILNAKALEKKEGISGEAGAIIEEIVKETELLKNLCLHKNNAVYSEDLDRIWQQLNSFNKGMKIIIDKIPKTNQDVITLLQNKTNANIKALASITTFAQKKAIEAARKEAGKDEEEREPIKIKKALEGFIAIPKNNRGVNFKQNMANALNEYIKSKIPQVQKILYERIKDGKKTGDALIDGCIDIIKKKNAPFTREPGEYRSLKDYAKEKANPPAVTETNDTHKGLKQ